MSDMYGGAGATGAAGRPDPPSSGTQIGPTGPGAPPLTTSGQEVNRSTKVPKVSENSALVNCREIEDWCRECREHHAPILTPTSGFIGFAGLLVGFLSGLSSTDRPGWHAVFLFGTLMAAIGMLLTGIAVAMARSPRVRNAMRRQEPSMTPLLRLADRMERAKEHNRVDA